MENSDKFYEGMREHLRINIRLPISTRFVPEEERNSIETKVYGYKEIYTREISDYTNLNVSETLNRIEKKLDTILNMLTIQQYGFHQLQETLVNLSGGGMSFISEKFFRKGDLLEIKMFLDEPVAVGLLVYGEIIRVMEKDSKYEIGLKFININEKQRDIIVRFVIYKHKQKQRNF